MKGINFVTNTNGEAIGLLIDLQNRHKLSSEDIEDIEDIISIELTKHEASEDFNKVVKRINKKKKISK